LSEVRLGSRTKIAQNLEMASGPWLAPEEEVIHVVPANYRCSRTRLLLHATNSAEIQDSPCDGEGSVTIDTDLMRAADIVEYEQVQIYDVNNGNRLTTYAIPGPAKTGVICINGAAAHLVSPGDLVIICSYAQFEEIELTPRRPRVVLVDASNRPVS